MQQTRAVETAAAEPESARVMTEGDWKINSVTIYNRVIEAKGRQAAEDARDFIVKVTKDYNFNAQSFKYPDKQGKEESRAWMLEARSLMLPNAAAEWTRTVNTYFSEKEVDGTDAWNNMSSLTFYAMYSENQFPKDASLPLMFNRTITDLDVDLASDGRVYVSVEAFADFNFMKRGKPAVSHITRNQQYWLDTSDGNWKIAGWKGRFNAKVVS